MAVNNHPRRQRKADRLLNPDATAAQIECDYGVAPLDREARIMDGKWGIDRLPEMVSPEMAAKYGRAMAHLNQCIRDNDPAKTAAAAQNCIKGLQAMDAWATEHAAPEATGHFYEYELEGSEGGEPFRFGVLADEAQWQIAKAKRPDLLFFTQREVAIALKARMESPLLAETKKHFPSSEITKITHKDPVDWKGGGDAIPF